MRVSTVLALVLLTSSAVAQDTTPRAPRSSYVAALSAGAAQNGRALRLIAGGERHLGSHISISLVSRVVVARGPYPVFGETSAGDDLYTELGVSLRPVWRPDRSFQLAASVGYGLAVLTVHDKTFAPWDDLGYTLPVEVEGAVRLWRGVGVTASASRSVALSSLRMTSEASPGPEGYEFDHWATTVGVRVGNW